ncbi:hypothetical protein K4043_14275 [Stenotrophomonas sp. SRS1]|uniref:hypothetical protein n=1 Tax=Stenotrophomonas sp. SRS1 TaxID=2870345 RepID=UPI0022375AED|nr:hypothetical protein [Stenotrophomonas sp. SRS1]MCW6029177.1 hypothetical protein [Stenotrophomonas sp. SRS1]
MSDSSPPTTSAPLLTPLLAADLAEYCLRATGPSSVQLVGEALAHLSTTLLAAGCEVSRYEAVTPGDAAVDMVIAWAASGEECSRFLAPGAAAVVIVGPAGAVQDAETWVAQAASLGWQQHPAPFALSGASDDVTVRVFARSGVSVTDPASLLRASYHGLAAALVRPGDAVLAMDAAEGDLWRIVLQQSRCSWLGVVDDQLRPAGEPGVEWLGSTQWQPAPRPIDVVVTRLSHDGSDWIQEVQAAHAALVRSGRLVIAVPLDSGRNPLQRDLLALLEQSGLVIDRAWWQSLTRPAGPDQFIEVSRDAVGQLKIDSDSVATADALVLMAVKVGGPGIAQDPSLKAPNLIAFHRDYLDASVVRLIVAVGLRLESAALRRPIARKVMHEAPVDSADYGAAVCVLLYDPVALEGTGRAELLAAARLYIDAPAANPTVLRWQVSLAFAAASLHQAGGDLHQAAELYARVLAFDVLAFSPLLGTKTTTAAVRLGWIHFGRGELAAARQVWARGLDEARRLASQPDWSAVIGDSDAPEVFAMPEFAAVMDEAGCLASALRLTAETPLRAGLAWQWSNRSLRLQLLEARNEQQRRQIWQDNLQEAKDWLDGQYHKLNAELFRRDQVIQALDATARKLAIESDGVSAAFRLAHRHAVGEKAALSQQLYAMHLEYDRLFVDHQHLSNTNQQLIGAAQQLSAAAGAIMSGKSRNQLPAESIAEEMFRLANALNRLPLKPLVRTVLRALTALLGRK